jgi:transposase
MAQPNADVREREAPRAMDEFAPHLGCRYATVIVDPRCKRVLWVGVGRAREHIRAFFALLGPARCAQIEAVAMDMNPASAAEVAAHGPQAPLVYDLFHVVAEYGSEVLDRIRVDETNKLARAAGPNRPRIRSQRRVIKGTRWLLLRNWANITRRADRVRLTELLRTNARCSLRMC